MRVVVTTPPDAEPVSLDEVKEALGVEHDVDDARIENLITTARRHAERVTGRSFITRTLTATFDAIETRGGFVLPGGPVQSVTTLETFDASDVATVVSADDYQVAGDFIGASPSGGFYVAERSRDAVRVVYVAGFGDAAEDVPEDVKEWIKAKARSLYDGDGMTADEETLLDPYVSYQFG